MSDSDLVVSVGTLVRLLCSTPEVEVVGIVTQTFSDGVTCNVRTFTLDGLDGNSVVSNALLPETSTKWLAARDKNEALRRMLAVAKLRHDEAEATYRAADDAYDVALRDYSLALVSYSTARRACASARRDYDDARKALLVVRGVVKSPS